MQLIKYFITQKRFRKNLFIKKSIDFKMDDIRRTDND